MRKCKINNPRLSTVCERCRCKLDNYKYTAWSLGWNDRSFLLFSSDSRVKSTGTRVLSRLVINFGRVTFLLICDIVTKLGQRTYVAFSHSVCVTSGSLSTITQVNPRTEQADSSHWHYVYMRWHWRHCVYASYRRHAGGILRCSSVTSQTHVCL